MNYCTTCGYKISETAKFCEQCGAPVLREEEPVILTSESQITPNDNFWNQTPSENTPPVMTPLFDTILADLSKQAVLEESDTAKQQETRRQESETEASLFAILNNTPEKNRSEIPEEILKSADFFTETTSEETFDDISEQSSIDEEILPCRKVPKTAYTPIIAALSYFLLGLAIYLEEAFPLMRFNPLVAVSATLMLIWSISWVLSTRVKEYGLHVQVLSMFGFFVVLINAVSLYWLSANNQLMGQSGEQLSKQWLNINQLFFVLGITACVLMFISTIPQIFRARGTVPRITALLSLAAFISTAFMLSAQLLNLNNPVTYMIHFPLAYLLFSLTFYLTARSILTGESININLINL